MTNIPSMEEIPGMSIIHNIIVTPDAVLNKLNALNINKSTRPDGLHPKVLKELAASIATPICALLNKCFEEGKIPSDWKHANVCCIFKKGDKSNPGNYRPISPTNI